MSVQDKLNGKQTNGRYFNIWATVLIAAIAAVPPTITAYYAGHKVNTVEKKVDIVHELTNSQLTAAITKSDSLSAKVNMLVSIIEELRLERKKK